jgi:hypothetical protein
MPAKTAIQKSWFLYGPQDCDMRRHADQIARSLGLRRIQEDWKQGTSFELTDTLIITREYPRNFYPFKFCRRVLSFEQAMLRVRAMQGAQANRDPANVRRRPVQQHRRAA